MKNKLFGIIAGSLLLFCNNFTYAGFWGLNNCSCGQWYVAASGSVVWHDELEFRGPNEFSSITNYKTGGGAAASLGYLFCLCNGWDLRVEEEILYRRTSLDKGTIRFVSGGTILADIGPGSGHIQDTALMTNVLLDIPIAYNIGVYLGTGIGVSFNEVKFSNIGALAVPFSNTSKDELFAWQLMIGFFYDFNRCLSLTAGYRLFMTEKIGDSSSTVKSREASKISSIDIGLMFRL